jgi:cysteine synthase A
MSSNARNGCTLQCIVSDRFTGDGASDGISAPHRSDDPVTEQSGRAHAVRISRFYPISFEEKVDRMKIAERITELVGNTPLLRLRTLSEAAGTTIIAKLEFFNPLASIKDRIAIALINAAEKNGELAPGGLIIEPTSGNTGMGLAYVAATRGYRLILTMPETTSPERRKMLELLGAVVELTPASTGMRGAVDRATALHREHPGSFMPRQFSNPVNPAIHRLTTAEEIWRDSGGNVDILVAGIGTGGTITGCGEYLKQRNPSIRIIGVEPEESAVLSGGSPGPHKIQGLGAGFIPDVFNPAVVDEVLPVSSADAFAMTVQLAKSEGIPAGISSGAAATAACTVAQRPENKNSTIIVIFPDSFERYLSTWIAEESTCS